LAKNPVQARPLHKIAEEIEQNWTKVNFTAEPYLDAMSRLDSVQDTYGADSAESIVRYFLANASSWRGDVARRVKAELKSLL
jgi:hypothetical protein